VTTTQHEIIGAAFGKKQKKLNMGVESFPTLVTGGPQSSAGNQKGNGGKEEEKSSYSSIFSESPVTAAAKKEEPRQDLTKDMPSLGEDTKQEGGCKKVGAGRGKRKGGGQALELRAGFF
jgi:hypothetical protein